jgi:hypothetical protein
MGFCPPSGFAQKVGSGLISQQIAPEEHDVYSLAVFISLRAPEERNVLSMNSYMPLLRSETILNYREL